MRGGWRGGSSLGSFNGSVASRGLLEDNAFAVDSWSVPPSKP